MPAAPVEMGSHISLSGAGQPSLLEVTAQDSLLSGLQPAFLHLLKVLGRLVPYLGAVERRCGAELFLVLHAALQHYCLKYHDASFSEHYYDLKRVDLRTLNNSTSPSTRAAAHAPAHEFTTSGAQRSGLVVNDRSSDGVLDSTAATNSTPLLPQPAVPQTLEAITISGDYESNQRLSRSTSKLVDLPSCEASSPIATISSLDGPDADSSTIDAVPVAPNHLNPNLGARPKSYFSCLNLKAPLNFMPSWLMRRLAPLRSSHARSLAVLALLPYLQQKISELYERSMDRQQSGVTSKALQLWPLVQLGAGVANVLCYLRYMGGTSPVCSLSHAACGVTLARRTEQEEEMRQQALEQLSWRERLASEVPGVLMDVLEAAAFLLQFLDWWYSSDRASSTASLGSSTAPPFPHQPPTGEDIVCPICHVVPRQPTALAVSGLVFCYACILPHVRGSLCCPVTGYPATTQQLVRIYHE